MLAPNIHHYYVASEKEFSPMRDFLAKHESMKYLCVLGGGGWESGQAGFGYDCGYGCGYFGEFLVLHLLISINIFCFDPCILTVLPFNFIYI